MRLNLSLSQWLDEMVIVCEDVFSISKIKECKEAVEEIRSQLSHNNAQPVNFALRFIRLIGAKLRAFFCSVKKLWSVAKVR